MKFPTLIDSHCHLDFAAFDPDRKQVIARAQELGVRAFIVPGTTAHHWGRIIQLCQQHACIFGALGLHPYFLDQHEPHHLEQLPQLLKHPKILAIGEIGLDFAHPKLNQAQQLELLKRQLAIASNLDYPVIIHSRKAHDQLFKQLRLAGIHSGIIHAFNGSLQQAYKFIDLGFCLGFGGMLTYPRAQRLRKLAQTLPLEALVLETDAPDMSGQAHRGQRNSPEYLPEVLAILAELRACPAETIAQQTTRNLQRVLKLPAIPA